jgi:hypothetical protein
LSAAAFASCSFLALASAAALSAAALASCSFFCCAAAAAAAASSLALASWACFSAAAFAAASAWAFSAATFSAAALAAASAWACRMQKVTTTAVSRMSVTQTRGEGKMLLDPQPSELQLLLMLQPESAGTCTQRCPYQLSKPVSCQYQLSNRSHSP